MVQYQSVRCRWLVCIMKKKEKSFDLLGTTLESEQYQEIPISII